MQRFVMMTRSGRGHGALFRWGRRGGNPFLSLELVPPTHASITDSDALEEPNTGDDHRQGRRTRWSSREALRKSLDVLEEERVERWRGEGGDG